MVQIHKHAAWAAEVKEQPPTFGNAINRLKIQSYVDKLPSRDFIGAQINTCNS